jgi:RNA polymerase sigma-32 factor
MVKVASTKSQRKLFFNLRRYKRETLALSHSQVQSLAKDLDVTEREVIEMDKRISGSDIPLDNFDDDDDRMAPANYLQTTETEPTAVLERDGRYRLYSDGIEEALSGLDPRSRRVIETRWMVDENPMTLQHLAVEFGISAERVRQIEAAALKKMRKTLTAYT